MKKKIKDLTQEQLNELCVNCINCKVCIIRKFCGCTIEEIRLLDEILNTSVEVGN